LSLDTKKINQAKSTAGENQDSYHLLGWSLGGKIALTIAATLESRGVTDIKVYLLDTVLEDFDYDTELFSQERIEEQIKESEMYYGDIENYELKARSFLLAEHKLNGQSIGIKLQDTQVVLFKALMLEERKQEDEAMRAVIGISDNGIKQVLNRASQLKIINMPYVNHQNILQDEVTLVLEIKASIN
jgi:poly(3-hydroxyalkanoate) synthetase